LRYFTATTVRVSAFVDGIQNSQEITHEKNLVDAEAETESYIGTMAELGNRLGPLSSCSSRRPLPSREWAFSKIF
jgi:hypothetical protein